MLRLSAGGSERYLRSLAAASRKLTALQAQLGARAHSLASSALHTHMHALCLSIAVVWLVRDDAVAVDCMRLRNRCPVEVGVWVIGGYSRPCFLRTLFHVAPLVNLQAADVLLGQSGLTVARIWQPVIAENRLWCGVVSKSIKEGHGAA